MTVAYDPDELGFGMDGFDLERATLGQPPCRCCGCNDRTPCLGGCYWVLPDLCSSCTENGPDGHPAPPYRQHVVVRQVA